MQVVELDQQPPRQPSCQTCKLDDRRIADRAQHGVRVPSVRVPLIASLRL